MKTFVHLYADGAAPLSPEQMSAADAREASLLAAGRIHGSPTFGYRLNPPDRPAVPGV